MEPESHRHDRELLLAERRAAAERVQREVDAVVGRRVWMDMRAGATTLAAPGPETASTAPRQSA